MYVSMLCLIIKYDGREISYPRTPIYHSNIVRFVLSAEKSRCTSADIASSGPAVYSRPINYKIPDKSGCASGAVRKSLRGTCKATGRASRIIKGRSNRKYGQSNGFETKRKRQSLSQSGIGRRWTKDHLRMTYD